MNGKGWRVRVNGARLDELMAWVSKLSKPDLQPIALDVARYLHRDHIKNALRGIDVNDRPLRVTQRELTGTGPQGKPLAPHGPNSRIVRLSRPMAGREGGRFYARVLVEGFNTDAGVPILRYHREGIPSAGGKIVRDMTSRLRPSTKAGAVQVLRTGVLNYIRRTKPR
jgi:hypothetical protein